MNKTYEIIFSGVGGQGLQLSGNLLGEAAAKAGKNAAMTVSYGTETRGTFSKSDLIVSDDVIDYPEVTEPDIILCLAQVAYDRYYEKVSEKTWIIYDIQAVTPKQSKARQSGFDFDAACEELGSSNIKNVIALGIIIAETKMLHPSDMTNIIKERFKKNPKIMNLDIEAFEKGLNMKPVAEEGR